ncbi:MAG: flagellar basal body-associated FliL family protein [Methylotenera sp.]|nr:flagellar basal body-associated FliL family protein [Oligoflexia bacterium]
MSADAKHDSSSSGSGSGGGNKLVMILTLVNLVAVVAMMAILFISFQKDRKKPSVDDITAETHASADAHGGGHGAPDAHGGGGHGAAEAHGGGDAHGGGGHGDAKKKGGDSSKMMALEQFTVNLSTPGSAAPKFVRVNIALEVPNDEAEGEVTQKMPQVRNAIIDLFNSKRPADLGTTEGREFIKEEIKNALNGFMISGKVKGVFFTNFAVSG